MANHTRAEEREMMLSPLKWPHMWLPLKRSTQNGTETAVLGTATTDGTKEMEVYVGANVFRLQETLNREDAVLYEDVDAVLDAGWVVD